MDTSTNEEQREAVSTDNGGDVASDTRPSLMRVVVHNVSKWATKDEMAKVIAAVPGMAELKGYVVAKKAPGMASVIVDFPPALKAPLCACLGTLGKVAEVDREEEQRRTDRIMYKRQQQRAKREAKRQLRIAEAEGQEQPEPEDICTPEAMCSVVAPLLLEGEEAATLRKARDVRNSLAKKCFSKMRKDKRGHPVWLDSLDRSQPFFRPPPVLQSPVAEGYRNKVEFSILPALVRKDREGREAEAEAETETEAETEADALPPMCVGISRRVTDPALGLDEARAYPAAWLEQARIFPPSVCVAAQALEAFLNSDQVPSDLRPHSYNMGRGGERGGKRERQADTPAAVCGDTPIQDTKEGEDKAEEKGEGAEVPKAAETKVDVGFWHQLRIRLHTPDEDDVYTAAYAILGVQDSRGGPADMEAGAHLCVTKALEAVAASLSGCDSISRVDTAVQLYHGSKALGVYTPDTLTPTPGPTLLYRVKHQNTQARVPYQVSEGGFVQVNQAASDVLFDAVAQQALKCYPSAPHIRLMDVCSGSGAMGLAVSHCAHQMGRQVSIWGVDIIEGSILTARANAEALGLDAEYVVGDARQAVQQYLDNLPQDGVPTVCVVDPSRAGLHPSVLKALRMESRIEHIIYVACSHKALAKDCLSLMERRGNRFPYNPFVPEAYFCVDMFPHTRHVETVLCMTRACDSTGDFAPQGAVAADAGTAETEATV
ncbi:(Uracil-5)-methyltransferase family protein [Kipferlia bialata]|uniref:(Uracil-5)-methyltransferase family protein n=1 Tax=Kipferlia bialata TaxID=797122 RepID=A0A9K3CVE9_9EUKA|nr:(Uracil-5)-methyltransferase family protein [Kipferlia bialata]|eukprot:g4442.t1